jgi:bifunctional oligoribonuclease and PAP phosphatase NrnA
MITDQFKPLAEEIKKTIDSVQNILLHFHPNPDPDSVGSALAMYHYLKKLGKNPTVVSGDSPKSKNMAVLPGFAEVVSMKVSEVNWADFDLFIIVDSANPKIVCRDEGFVIPESVKTIVIDHHQSNSGFGQINFIDTSKPAAAEVIFNLFKYWGVEIDANIAINLFVGIYYDTGGFRFRSVSAETLRAGAELVALCPNFSEILQAIDTVSEKSLVYKGLALGKLKRYGSKQNIALVSVSNEELESRGIGEEDMANQSIAGMILAVEGVEVAVSVIEKDLGKNRISMRSRNGEQFDVSKIQEVLGGGGHKQAAGSMVEGGNVEAVKKVTEAIWKVYPDCQ